MKTLHREDSCIFGDILLADDINISRAEAENILESLSFKFADRTDSENWDYSLSYCVMHLNSCISSHSTKDVVWCYSDCSLYQKLDGSFFVAQIKLDEFDESELLYADLEADYFLNHNKQNFIDMLIEKNAVTEEDAARLFISEDLDEVFRPRNVTFYTERYLDMDYTLLFHDADGNHDNMDFELKCYENRFEKSPDKDVILGHVRYEARKALDCMYAGRWKKLDWSDYKRLFFTRKSASRLVS
ncbi:hypothetical protein [Treponema zioleckii]|uniref:hypothetical protein n=1 Tax=Treponema zioleckii TaxID=331680 RepID=UPI00168BD3CA|nr:hypothetical protein [Treponema zioleckii]